MKTVSMTLEDDLYEAAEAQAVRSRSAKTQNETTTQNALWQLADAHPLTPGSVGPLNREGCYERGLSGY